MTEITNGVGTSLAEANSESPIERWTRTVICVTYNSAQEKLNVHPEVLILICGMADVANLYSCESCRFPRLGPGP